jgi:hypothetical protein
MATSGLAKDGHLGWIASKVADKLFYPLECNQHVANTLVSWKSGSVDACVDALKETEETQTIVDGDNDNLATAGHVGGVEGRVRSIASSE